MTFDHVTDPQIRAVLEGKPLFDIQDVIKKTRAAWEIDVATEGEKPALELPTEAFKAREEAIVALDAEDMSVEKALAALRQYWGN